MGKIRQITTLFNLFDGKIKKFNDEMKEAFENLYHKDVVMLIEGEKIDYDRIFDAYVAFAEEGVKLELFKIEETDDGVKYEAGMYYPEGDVFFPKTKATFKDERIILLEPQDPAQIEDFIEEKEA